MAVNVTPSTETRPAPKTTEFWISISLIVLGAIQQIFGIINVSDSRVALLQTLVASAYAIARGLAKQGVPNQ